MATKTDLRECLFAANNEPETADYYCGHSGNAKDMRKGIGHVVESQIADLLDGHVKEVTITFTRKLLTDSEIENLSDCD